MEEVRALGQSSATPDYPVIHQVYVLHLSTLSTYTGISG